MATIVNGSIKYVKEYNKEVERLEGELTDLETWIDAKKLHHEQGLINFKTEYEQNVNEQTEDYNKYLFDKGLEREALNIQLTRMQLSHRKQMIMRESAQAKLAEQMNTERGPSCPVVDLDGPVWHPPAPPPPPESLIINPCSDQAGHLAHSIVAGQGVPIEMVQAVLMAQHAHQQAIFTAHAASIPAQGAQAAASGTARSLPPTLLGSILHPLPGTAQADRKEMHAQGGNANTANKKDKGRNAAGIKENIANMVPATPPFPPSPLTPAPGTPGYSPTEYCISENGDGVTKTAPYEASNDDSDSDVDEIKLLEAMDEEGQ